MKKQKIRVIAVSVFQNAGRILVFKGHDPVKGETFYRPLGGAIEFGETSQQALVREIREELGEEIRNPRYLGMLENIFVYLGEPGHEIFLVYDAEFVNPDVYKRQEMFYTESDGSRSDVLWAPLEDFHADQLILYPVGLYDLLKRQSFANLDEKE